MLSETGDSAEAPKVVVKPGIKSFSEVTQTEWFQLDIDSVKTSEAAGELTINERVGHALISYPETKKIYMIGGGNHSGDLNEVWVIDYSSPIEPLKGIFHESSATFPGRYEFACASNGKGQAWIFGGADFQLPRNDVLLFDLETETMVLKEESNQDSENIPTPRTQGNNCCLLELNGEEHLAVFGGGQKGETAVPDGNIYLYKIADGEWKRVDVKSNTPDPVQGHAMVSIGSVVYVHGGMQHMNLFDSLHMIDLSESEPTWIPVRPEGAKPCARAAHGIIGVDNEFYIYGGLGDDGALSDLWKFNTESLQWTKIDVGQGKPFPSARFDFAITRVCISGPEGGKTSSMLLLHGGMNTEGELFKDYWVYPLSL